MDTIKVAQSFDAASVRYTGLYISYKGGIASQREILELEAVQERLGLPLTIEMPCGEVATYETLEDIPLVDTPCPCGDPDHWSVRWMIWMPSTPP